MKMWEGPPYSRLSECCTCHRWFLSLSHTHKHTHSILSNLPLPSSHPWFLFGKCLQRSNILDDYMKRIETKNLCQVWDYFFEITKKINSEHRCRVRVVPAVQEMLGIRFKQLERDELHLRFEVFKVEEFSHLIDWFGTSFLTNLLL